MSLRLENLNKRFGLVAAVQDLSVEVETGAFVSLVGPSGCGKTTTLRMISGFETPDSGKIYVNGEFINNVPVKQRNMGIVFQNYALFPNLTVKENIAFGLVARKQDKNVVRRKVEEMLVLIGLPHIGERQPAQLSGGQQQRVALARSLAVEPSLLLLDEPLSALDAKIRINLRFEIKRIQKKLNITTIYITHDQEEALSISDRVVVMNEGRIQQIGSPKEVYNAPSNGFVADFIGISSKIEATVTDASGGNFRMFGRELSCGRPLPFENGDRIAAVLRPEDIQLSRRKDGDFSGIIEGTTFLGSFVRFKLRVENKTLLVDRPKGERDVFSTGQIVSVRFNMETLIFVQDEF